MARQQREASAADVRQWALDENWTDSNGNGVGERGRFSSELVEAFNKAHRRNNVAYMGGSPSGNTGNTNSRTQSAPARTQNRASNSSPATRRPPARTSQQAEAPAPRQRQRQSAPEDVRTAVIAPSGTGLSEEQMEQFNRMLADANAVTGQQMELTIIRLAPAAVA